MNKFDCQNLTETILNLQTLKNRVDLAINKFEPEDGVKAAKDAKESADLVKVAIEIGLEEYAELYREIYDEDKLSKRRGSVIVGGESVENLCHILSRLISEDSVSKIAAHYKEFFKTVDFKRHIKTPEDIQTIKLTVEELGFNKPVKLNRLYARAKALGLRLCPQDTGLFVLLDPLISPAYGEIYVVASEPVVAEVDGLPKDEWLLDVYNYGESCISFSGADSGSEYGPTSKMLFRLPDLEREDK
jgi:hypothetical protein